MSGKNNKKTIDLSDRFKELGEAGKKGSEAGKRLADSMIKVKTWYPKFIVKWLVGRAIERDLKNDQ